MRKVVRSWLYLIPFIVLLAGAGMAYGQAPVLGKDYQVLNPPQPTDSGNKVEVLDFFWYGCPHCAHLVPYLDKWLKHKPADVDFKHQPAAFQDSWLQLARTYYTFEALGLVSKLHDQLFDAIHIQHTLNPAILARDPSSLFDWVASKGVNRKKFVDAYNSFGVVSRTQRTIDRTLRYDIQGTPTLVIDGRYLTAPSMTLKPDGTIDYDRFFRVVDDLIAMARKNHGRK